MSTLSRNSDIGGTLSLADIDPATYCPHALHISERTYRESNCYADVLIELVNVRGQEPRAMFGFVVRTDWEGDQFTYCKPLGADLRELFGLDVHEMLPYMSVPEHIEERLSTGDTVLVELDAWWLPDTHATSYRAEHVKTTVAPTMIDREGRRMRYFHHAGHFELEGEDYDGAFRLLPQFTDDVMDPFIEVARFVSGPALEGDDLRAAGFRLLQGHYALRPRRNPFEAWGEHLEAYLPRLLEGGPERYHAYAFVTARMVGAAFELLGEHLDWLAGADAEDSVAAVQRIVQGTKTLSFRLARRRAFEPAPFLAELADGWEQTMEAISELLQ